MLFGTTTQVIVGLVPLLLLMLAVAIRPEPRARRAPMDRS